MKLLLLGAGGPVATALLDKLCMDEAVSVYGFVKSQASAERLNKKYDFSRFNFSAVDLLAGNSPEVVFHTLSKNNFYPTSLIMNARSVENLKTVDGFVSVENFSSELNLAVVVPYLVINKLIKEGCPLSSIVFVSSIYGNIVPNKHLYADLNVENPLHYSIAKSAQIHLAKELAVRLAEKKVRVNTVSLGGVKGRATKEFEDKYSMLTPQSKMIDASECVEAMLFLLEESKSSSVNGHNLVIDGGYTLW